MKIRFCVALATSVFCTQVGAQSASVIANTQAGEFPIIIRAADGTMMRCRAGTNIQNLQSDLRCRSAAGLTREQVVGRQFGNPGGVPPLALGAGALLFLGMAFGSSSASGT